MCQKIAAFIITSVVVVTGMFQDVKVDYKLYTPELGKEHGTIFKKNEYNNTVFDPTRVYKILCHGWTGHAKSTWYLKTIEEYFKHNLKFNVISTSYRNAVRSKTYVAASINVDEIGQKIGYMLINLKQTKNIPYERMHIIGHSLGAHIAGVIGETIFKNTGLKVGRITGLDPASILFSSRRRNEQISQDDAIFVDIIHTSSIIAFSHKLGKADFYPNGGKIQRGCKPADNTCYHNMAPIYFYESINNELFVSTNCSNYKVFETKKCGRGAVTSSMGEHVDINSNGSYYLITDKKFGEKYYVSNIIY